MADELSGRKDGDVIRIYRVSDFWYAKSVWSRGPLPTLTEEDFWFFNQRASTQDSLVESIKRVNNVSMEFAITLFKDGRVADGFHRILHAGVNGITRVDIRTLIEDPEPIEIVSATEYVS